MKILLTLLLGILSSIQTVSTEENMLATWHEGQLKKGNKYSV